MKLPSLISISGPATRGKANVWGTRTQSRIRVKVGRDFRFLQSQTKVWSVRLGVKPGVYVTCDAGKNRSRPGRRDRRGLGLLRPVHMEWSVRASKDPTLENRAAAFMHSALYRSRWRAERRGSTEMGLARRSSTFRIRYFRSRLQKKKRCSRADSRSWGGTPGILDASAVWRATVAQSLP